MYYLNLTFLWLNFGISAMFLFYFNVVQVCRKMKRRNFGGGGILVYLNCVWKIHDFCYLREILAIENLKNHFILAIILFYLTF